MKTTNKLNSVKVIFANSRYNYITSVSENTNEKYATKYFVGTFFNVGIYPTENMQQCTRIEFKTNKTK